VLWKRKREAKVKKEAGREVDDAFCATILLLKWKPDLIS